MRDKWREAAEEADGLWEIRLRVHREIILIIRGREYFLGKNGRIVSDMKNADVMTQQDMEAVLAARDRRAYWKKMGLLEI